MSKESKIIKLKSAAKQLILMSVFAAAGFAAGSATIYNSAINSNAAYFHPNKLAIVWGQPSGESEDMAKVQTIISSCKTKGEAAKSDLLCNFVIWDDEDFAKKTSKKEKAEFPPMKNPDGIKLGGKK